MRHAAALVLFLIATVATCLAGGKPLPPPQYIPVILPGEELAFVYDINNLGEMVGYYYTSGDQGCFAIINGAVYKFTFGAYTPSCNGVNSSGTIVGEYHPTNNTGVGFLIQDRKRTDVAPPDSVYSAAWAINDMGQIVGGYKDQGRVTHGFLYDGTTYQQIDVPGAVLTEAYGINNHGQIALQWVDDQNITHSSIFDGSTYTPVAVPGAYSTEAYHINNLGDVAIVWEDSKTQPHGAALKNGKYYILGYPGDGTTVAFGINDQDIIVGYATGTAYSGGFKLIP